MKRLLTLLICFSIVGTTIVKLPEITETINDYFYSAQTVVLPEENKYAKNQTYEYVSVTNNFVPYNFQELLNIFYTILDRGYQNFTFYCPVEYEDCINDVKIISDKNNKEYLTTLGNYVSPFNNFTILRVKYDSAGEINVNIDYTYTEEDKRLINKKLDDLWVSLVKPEMSTEDIIYAFHDYFINTTRYDESYEEKTKNEETTNNPSSKANGVLFDGLAICSGYTDAMALVLDRLNIPNFKVASTTHVWNAVKLNNEWLHLDLTWDDPVSLDHSKDNLLHKFYLINTKTLEEFEIEDHDYNKSVYLELK